MNKRKDSLVKLRANALAAEIGETITCPSCKTKHVKKAYNTVFCKVQGGSKCKDNYWNNVDPKKRNNKTRISPASARFMAKQQEIREENYDPDDEHPFSCEGLGQWTD